MSCENVQGLGHGQGELMDVEIQDASNGCITEIRENGLLLWPVMPQEEGEGLPYAPVNWPNDGDIWGWRVGKRVSISGHYLDRYLYLPSRLQKSKRKRDGFASKLAVAQYIRARFPGADVNAFFASFCWRIPSKQAYLSKDEHGSFSISSEEMAEQSPSFILPGVGCKAGNIYCPSLSDLNSPEPKPAQICDICCLEPGFCRECSCVLCSRSVDFRFGGYNFIRCEATIDDDFMCGHVTHLECALRSYLAGTVGGTIGLDTEFLCRRCDQQTDLNNHILKLLKTCESVDSRDNLEKILALGYCLLRGSAKKDSQKLFDHFDSLYHKVKADCDLQDLWKVKMDIVPVSSGQKGDDNFLCENMLYQNEYLNLEVEVREVLEMLKSSQRVEYRIAKDRLYAQKDVIDGLYKQLEKEKKELEGPTISPDRFALLKSIMGREYRIKCEIRKLRDMEKVAKGFSKTPKDVIKEHFVEECFDFNE